MARAAVENACWDLTAQNQKYAALQITGRNNLDRKFPVESLLESRIRLNNCWKRLRRKSSAGYRRIKIKIKPGWDYDILRLVRQTYPDIPLSVDANSAYTLADINLIKRFDEFNLLMIEQPLGYDDIVDHSHLQKQISTAICLDEPITSTDKARKAIEMESGRIINIKLGRVGGFSEAIRIHDYCYDNQIPVWCGGMLEAGIGRSHNIAMSTLPGFSLPGDVSASKRYFKEDIIEPPVTVNARRGLSMFLKEPAPDTNLKMTISKELLCEKRSFQYKVMIMTEH